MDWSLDIFDRNLTCHIVLWQCDATACTGDWRAYATGVASNERGITRNCFKVIVYLPTTNLAFINPCSTVFSGINKPPLNNKFRRCHFKWTVHIVNSQNDAGHTAVPLPWFIEPMKTISLVYVRDDKNIITIHEQLAKILLLYRNSLLK